MVRPPRLSRFWVSGNTLRVNVGNYHMAVCTRFLFLNGVDNPEELVASWVKNHHLYEMELSPLPLFLGEAYAIHLAGIAVPPRLLVGVEVCEN
jgi:hypothetical protein